MNIIQQMQQALDRLQSEGVLTAYLGDSDEAMAAKRAAREVLAKAKAGGDAVLLDAASDMRAALAALIPDMQHELPNITARFNGENAVAVLDAIQAKLDAARAALAKVPPGA